MFMHEANGNDRDDIIHRSCQGCIQFMKKIKNNKINVTIFHQNQPAFKKKTRVQCFAQGVKLTRKDGLWRQQVKKMVGWVITKKSV